jgi:hypothetical protein
VTTIPNILAAKKYPLRLLNPKAYGPFLIISTSIPTKIELQFRERRKSTRAKLLALESTISLNKITNFISFSSLGQLRNVN